MIVRGEGTVARVRAIVVDDEPVSLQGLASLVRSDSEVDVVAECSDGRLAIEAIQSLRPHLVFLDVQMPEVDGFQVIEAVGPDHMPAVVFVTAYDRFAIRAFEVSAVDYLLKPFSDERVFQALQRAKQVAQQRNAATPGQLRQLLEALNAAVSSEEGRSQFVIREPSRVYYVPIDSVDWIEGADYYAKLHVGTKVHLLREPLSALADRLDPQQFFRIHRSTIVNLNRVVEVRSAALSSGESVVLRDGTSLRIAKGRRSELERLLERVRR